MTTILELLVVSVAVLVAVIAAYRLGDKWQKLPHFVWNKMAKRTAYCSITDYNRAPLETFPIALSGEVRHFRRVPDTTCYNVADESYVPHPSIYSADLFVPGISEAFMTTSEQEKFFTPPLDTDRLQKFIYCKHDDNLRADFRLRWAEWQRKYEGGLLLTGALSVLAIMGLIIAFGIAWSSKSSGPYVDRTHYQVTVSNINIGLAVPDKDATYTTDEAPITLPNCTLKKVSVQRNNENFRYTAFVEPDQADKITKKGQEVKIYEVQYYYSSTGNPQSLLIAKIE